MVNQLTSKKKKSTFSRLYPGREKVVRGKKNLTTYLPFFPIPKTPQKQPTFLYAILENRCCYLYLKKKKKLKLKFKKKKKKKKKVYI